MGPPGAVAQGKVAEQQARHADVLDDVLGAAHDHGGDAVLLQMPGGQRRRLMADRTVGHDNGGVGLVLAQAGQHIRAIAGQGRRLGSVGRQAVEAGRHAADPAPRRRPPERRQRKPCAHVQGRGVLAVIGDVGNPHIRLVVDGLRIDLEKLGRPVVGRAGALVAQLRPVARRRRQQRHPAFVQRLGQPAERHLGKRRPPVGLAIAQPLVIGADARQIGDRCVVGWHLSVRRGLGPASG